eukprot:11214860-Lingulodinium_polyedra.AAC.1
MASPCASASSFDNGEGCSCAAEVKNRPSGPILWRGRWPPRCLQRGTWNCCKPGRLESNVVGFTDAAPQQH